MLFCLVFSLSFQTTTNASLLSLQNAINPLNHSQRTITRIVNSNGGTLNTPGILVFLIYFVLFYQQTNKKNNIFDGIDEPVVDSAVGT